MDLLERVQEEFSARVEKSADLKKYYELVEAGDATYEDAAEAADALGAALAESYAAVLSEDAFPMAYDLAALFVGTPLRTNYSMAADIAAAAQECVNKAAGLGLKAVRPKCNQSRIDGLTKRVSEADSLDSAAWLFDRPVKNFTRNVVDESVRANAEFQGKSGISARIVRKAAATCCAWCRALAGEYIYPNVPDDIYKRHEGCSCQLTYHPGDGKYQDVWATGKGAKSEWKYEVDEEAVAARKAVGRDNTSAEELERRKTIGLDKTNASDTMKLLNAKEETSVQIVGAIDRAIYKCATSDIKTEEVIITGERIAHIEKNHPGNYAKYGKYIYNMLSEPDYLIRDAHPSTVMVLKEFLTENGGEQFRLALRLATSTDDPTYKNSIITFMYIRKSEYARIVRNKEILYKRS